MHKNSMIVWLAIATAITISTVAYRMKAPRPIMDENSKSTVQQCLDKDWIVHYFNNGFKLDITCIPPRNPSIPAPSADGN